MGAQSGLATQMTSPVTETAYGTVPAALASTTKFAAFTSETLKGTKVPVQGIGLLQNKLFPQAARRVIAEWTAGGQVTMDLPARGLNDWLLPMFSSYGQAPAALTQDLTTGAYKAVHAPGFRAGHSFALQKGAPTADTGAVEPFTFVGCKVADWELSAQRAAAAKLVMTIDARNELAGAGNGDPLNASVPGLVTYVAPPAGGMFHWAQSQIYTGGTCTTTAGVTSVTAPVVAGNVKSFSVKYTAALDHERYFANKAGFKDDQLDNGLAALTVQLVIEWLSSEARYDAYAADTPTPVQLGFTGPVIGTGTDHSSLTILIPDMFLDDAPAMVPGPEVITQTIPLTGLDDGANNPIQATYWTLDAA